MLSTEQQLLELISKARHILVTFAAQRGGDAVASALALGNFLEQQGKQVSIISHNWQASDQLKFLPGIDKIQNQLPSLQKFVISLNVADSKLRDLSYDVQGDRLRIYLTPKHGSFSAADITTRSSNFLYDLIFVLDSPDLESLGGLYQNNTDFFYQTTIVNIDHGITNEHFGQINIVDFNVASTAELVLKIIKRINPQAIDQNTATCLFTGLTVASKSFKANTVTPITLGNASELIALGAEREKVVTNLYRTKTLPMLKLWGRALARIRSDSARKLVWLLLQPDDFIKSGAGEKDLPGVIDEVISTTPQAAVVILFYEQKAGQTSVLIQCLPGRNALELLKPWQPQGDQFLAKAHLADRGLLEAEQVVIEHLRQVLPENIS